ncbi:MAG: hypothetical protein ABL958_09085 [Bdellovibrionia bacterium]
MYIEAELARPRPRKIKYVPKDNPIAVDPIWLCLGAVVMLAAAGILDVLRSGADERAAMTAVLPLLVAPFLVQALRLRSQRRLVEKGEAVPALLNMVPKKLWWPKDLLGFSGVIYDVQAKYEYGGRTYVLDRLSRDPTKWRGRFVTVVLDPAKPARAVIYQICPYQVE